MFVYRKAAARSGIDDKPGTPTSIDDDWHRMDLDTSSEYDIVVLLQLQHFKKIKFDLDPIFTFFYKIIPRHPNS